MTSPTIPVAGSVLDGESVKLLQKGDILTHHDDEHGTPVTFEDVETLAGYEGMLNIRFPNGDGGINDPDQFVFVSRPHREVSGEGNGSLQPQEAVVPASAEGQVSGQWTYHHGDLNPVPGQHVDMLQRHGGWAHGQSDVEPWHRYWAWGVSRKSGSDIVAYRMATVIHDVMTKWSDYEDDLADVIGDSIDMDWTSRDGAKAVVRWLETFKPDTEGMSAANEPSPSNPPPEGKVASQREAVDVRDVLWKALQKYTMNNMGDGDGFGYPLIDLMSNDGTEISTGREEMFSLADHLWGALHDAKALASPTEQASDVSGLVEALEKVRDLETRSHHDGYDDGPGGGNYIYRDVVFTDELFPLVDEALSQAQQVKP